MNNVALFVDLLDLYLYFFMKENPVVTEAYIAGLVALIREHLESLKISNGTGSASIVDATAQFDEILLHIKRRQSAPELAEKFRKIQL